VLKEERHERILEQLARSGRVLAGELGDLLGVSPDTVRRDLDELARSGAIQRVRGGALARSPVPRSYAARREHALAGKLDTARAAAQLLEPDQVVILDGGSTALALAQLIPLGHTGTVVTHSPPVASALARHEHLEVVVVGGVLDRRAMVTTGAQTIDAYRGITADVCFLGVWSLHAEHGLSEGYPEEARVRAALLERAGRIVALASREKLGTVAPFAIGPATAITHLATERDTPDELLAPFAELGLSIVRAGRGRAGRGRSQARE
jgi:DeoR/GlpR family transcriptional regulator of sugar metabolism